MFLKEVHVVLGLKGFHRKETMVQRWGSQLVGADL